ncbi:dna repair protein rad26 [Diplodia corticola]|uniref:Dna repair protein rad26 n=1 Tax=Diplodia corticola TaxID=236234 RepID=A0A1J9R1D1_9PEZI|nr:dna repair protein rad26 [Diplodia corticola]OJD34401.1 dna repair protein rad26 [Diplodia corticola]
MAGDDDEFGSADELDALSLDKICELESQAFASTQHRRNSNAPPDANTQAPPQPALPPSEYDFPDADSIQLDGQPLLAKLPAENVTGPLQRFGGSPTVTATTRRTAQDLAANQREHFYKHRLNRHARNSNYDLGVTAPSSVPPLLSADDLANAGREKLKAKIDELVEAIANVNQIKNEAESQALKRAGEAALVRVKLEKADKVHVAEIISMQRTHKEQVAALETQIKVLTREAERLKSEYGFMEHDLRTEASKAKSRRNLKDGTAHGNSGKQQATTPKRNRRHEFGDGFDDGGVKEVSPSKSRDKSRNGTPRQGAKRKRNAIEASPAKPLPLSEPQQPQVPDDESIIMPDAERDVPASASKSDARFKLLQRLMNHRPAGLRVRTFEAFTRFAFPSLPGRLLSSVIYDGISLYHDESSDFPLHFCRILLSIWDRCAQEDYYEPLHLILDTLQFVLAFEPLEKTASLAGEIVPLAQTSANLVVWTSLDNPELKQHIDLQECLCLMLTVSRSCARDVEATTRFWSLISRDFIRALFKSPFLSTLSLTVQLLATSITPTSVGPIPDYDPADLPANSANLNKAITATDHLTSLLRETPDVVPSQPALWSFRLTLLHTFSAFLQSPAAAATLATHKYFLGRLFVCLNDAVATLYATAPRTPLAATLGRIANLGTRIAFILITDPATRDLVDRHDRLHAVHGASHAHLVALTRLAFVDVDADADVIDDGDDGGPAAAGGFGGARVLEAGIEEEVVDMAHQLLDQFLSPSEGVELMKVFSSARTVM